MTARERHCPPDPAPDLRLRPPAAGPGGGDPAGPRRRRRAGADADRRRQVAVLPDPGARAGRHGRRRLAADRADAGPGRRAAAGSASRAAFLNSTLDAGRAARASSGGCAPASSTCSTSRPSACCTDRTLDAARPRRRSRCSPSTRRTASRSGATTSAPSTCSSRVLAERFPGVPRIALTATADEPHARARSCSELALERRAIVRRRLRPAEHPLPRRPRSGSAREQLLALPRSRAPRRRRHRLLPVAQAGRGDRRVAVRAQGWHGARLPRGPRPRRCARRNQERFLARGRRRSSSPPSPSAWASTSRTCASSPTSTCRKSLEAYYQETGRAGRDGLPADAWMAYGLQDVILLRRLDRRSPTADETPQAGRAPEARRAARLCEVTGCRRQVLLAYFGDGARDPCGNCDNCLEPVETWDGTEAAQKALSASTAPASASASAT